MKLPIQKIVIIVVILAITILALSFIKKRHPNLPTSVKIDTADQPTMGNAKAKVHIVVFEDLKCIACRQFNNNLLPLLKQKYIETGVASYTVINVAFIPGSMSAANAARCLYREKPEWFFEFVDYVYQNQPSEQEDWATIPKLVEFASHIPNVNQQKLSRCIFESPYTSFIQNNLQQGEKLMGGTVYTPTVFINGYRVDPLTPQRIDQVINAVK